MKEIEISDGVPLSRGIKKIWHVKKKAFIKYLGNTKFTYKQVVFFAFILMFAAIFPVLAFLMYLLNECFPWWWV
ncbi:hypothetical protein VL10_23955 [Leclercia adecarboxylata]|nr:hypothetical protein VL10_23955 [Leclercia adecarboxylata]KMN66735.1 hypothetical protein VK95_04395 [Leclercia sp. LK8]